MTYEQIEKEFIEKGADLEHDRWAKWQRYLHSKCFPHTVNSLNSTTRQYEDIPTGALVIPRELRNRWDRQIDTNYLELSELEKESDRVEARSYIPLLKQSFIRYLQSQVEHVNAMVVNKPNKVALLNKELPSTLQTNYYNQAVGYVDAIEDIVTYLEAQIKELEV